MTNPVQMIGGLLFSIKLQRDEEMTAQVAAFFSKGDDMASKAKLIRSTESTPAETAAEETQGLLDSAREEEIRNRAYEIYLQRGEQPGDEVDDWLQAERELT